MCRYNLSAWAIKLNEITPGLKEKLAPTDCRLRPDQHATECGDYDEVWICLSDDPTWVLGGSQLSSEHLPAVARSAHHGLQQT